MLKNVPKSISMGKEYQEADIIIRFLTNPEDEGIELTETQKNKLLLLKEIHGYRLRHKRKNAVVKLLINTHDNINEQRAYYLIRECEYVFGAVNNVEKDYERQYILEASRRNLEFAFKTKDSKKITQALEAHYKFCGLDKENIDLPDFSKLEQHNYIINLPDHFKTTIQTLINSGVINLNDLIPPSQMPIDITHKEISNDESASS